ncbi:hypothetical protein [Natronorubrum texcoconense]|nr:hypothetical protein [Natronorubrum texcoconense]
MTISKVFVVFLFLIFAVISVANNSAFVAALAGVGVFVTAAVLFPLEQIRDGLEWFNEGGAGKWLHNGYLRVMPGRSPDDRRRGQIGPKTLLALAMVVLMVSSLAIAGVAMADEDSNETATVTHDEYLTDGAYAAEFNDSSSVELTDRNVKTSIEETDAFVRVKADNPNSYAVEVTMKVHQDIIPPAEVGDVSDTDDDVTASWENTHDFEQDESYTEITFTMDANSDVTFAPSKVRIHTMAWKDTATSGDGWLDRITSPFGSEGDLEERTYTLNSSDGSIQTVPLQNNDGQSIDDWHAVYRTGPDDDWTPITTDSSDAAFYRTASGGEAVKFHFDTDNYADGEVEVEFTADPNLRDQFTYEIRSLTAGWTDMVSFDILSVSAPTSATEVIP